MDAKKNHEGSLYQPRALAPGSEPAPFSAGGQAMAAWSAGERVMVCVADQPQAQDHRRRVNDLLTILSLIDSLAQRFFESQRGLRAAVDLLVQKDE